jgi:tRNA(Ile)-lysidine synthase
MHPLVTRVRRTIRRHDLIPRGGRVVVAVSGGSDSVALLHLLRALGAEGDLRVAAVAHFNHRLRGAASDEDEAFCRRLAALWAMPFVADGTDVAAAAAADRTSIELAGRRLRYAFFDRAAAAHAADRVAVGHTRDDQAETVLLRLLRGAGPEGLAAIHPRAGPIVRPVLDVPRADLRAYLAEHRVAFCDDATNLDVEVPRNRVRHELLPLLAARFTPGIVDVLSREADIAREDAAFLGQAAAAAEALVVRATPEGVVVDLPALAGQPVAVARRILRRAMAAVAPDRFIGFETVQAVLDLADTDGEPGRQVDAPGLRAERRGDSVVLRSRRARVPAPEWPAPFCYLLPVPGEVTVPEAGCRVSADVVDVGPRRGGWSGGRSDLVAVAASALASPLTVRSRRAGDAFRPLGLGGRKKLQDFFVDRKVPRALRDRVPLVVDGLDRIVWVVGHGVGEEFRVTDPAKAVVVLRLKDLGGKE